jgi:hypothetical protein
MQKTRASLATNLPVSSACSVRNGFNTARSESQNTGAFPKHQILKKLHRGFFFSILISRCFASKRKCPENGTAMRMLDFSGRSG